MTDFPTSGQNRLTNLQIELLKSLKYIVTERQLAEIKSLIRYYFADQLNRTIEVKENDEGYAAATYENWLKSKIDNIS